MNKEEAIQFIYQQLGRNCPQEQIVEALRQQLGAPRELVEKFVAMTARDYQPPIAPPAEPLIELPTEPPSPPPIETLPAAQPASAVKLPPWLCEDNSSAPMQASTGAPLITTIQQAEEYVTNELMRRRPRTEIIQELAQLTGEPVDLAARFLAVVENRQSPAPAHPATPAPPRPAGPRRERLTLDENPELVKFVVSELGKHRKRSDVVTAVCERTGREWNEVQRFVGEVEVQMRGKVQARKNILLIPLGILVIIGGLGLALSGIGDAILLATYISGANLPQTTAAIGSGVYALFFGVAIIGVGVYSIYRGIRAQLD